MAIVNPSQGYPGALVPGIPWANMQKMLGRRYMVADENAVKVTALGSGTRQVTVAPGFFGGHGILDYNDNPVTVTLPTVGSGTQYFMIVARRTWGVTNATTFEVISGGTTTTLPSRNTSPGTIDDQPLALVPLTAGSTVPGTPLDLRLIGVGVGEQVTNSDVTRQYATDVGTILRVGERRWERRLNAGGTAAAWQELPGPNSRLALTKLTSSAVWTSQPGWSGASSACQQIGILNGNSVTVVVQLRRTGALIPAGTSGSVNDIQIGTVNDARLRPTIELPASFVYLGGPNPTSKGSFGGMCTFYPSGAVILNSLQGQADLTQAATSGTSAGNDWSVRMHFTFNREDAS